MGLLVDGKWQDRWYDTKTSGGKFIREDAQFRSWVTPTAPLAPRVMPALRRSRVATISTSPTPAPGPIGP